MFIVRGIRECRNLRDRQRFFLIPQILLTEKDK